ncbi:MAG: hypothetical protein CMP50_03610 [Flavobacteriales bacterium]|nr:hypothetical protein [Flavobacteriales bacterium]|tara:strand:- start:2739 stop:3929 length:1191 start_codon:yes stop_codon:yes gene_type:complete
MKLPNSFIPIFLLTFFSYTLFAQKPGIYDANSYLPFLKNKNVAIVGNQTSRLFNIHLIDTLTNLGINIKCIFSPEHGFLGRGDAGEYISDSIYDSIPIISLYGDSKQLKDSDLNNIDVVIFDIQDVGVRFYTYISTLHYVMEGCARNNIHLIVLDRPNPHAHYVDGPVLDSRYLSFVGMHPVPVVYGMTIGEYALMINGEGWLVNNITTDLTIVKIENYSRFDKVNYTFNYPPSPNLPNMNAIKLYPSMCFFEGTIISVGRGTDFPFEVFGAPFFKSDSIGSMFTFLPQPNTASNDPKYNGQLCYGWDLSKFNFNKNNFLLFQNSQLNLQYLIYAFNNTPASKKNIFFNSFFNKLAGNNQLKQQILQGSSVEEIRASWEKDLLSFMKIREKYLLYN